jgi:threonine/homoserine/homoserine lactone efflux protein
MPEDQNKSNPTLVEVFTTFFRAVTRPAVTVIFAAVIAQVVVEGIDPPQWFLGLAGACILWWFGDRTVQHIKGKKDV